MSPEAEGFLQRLRERAGKGVRVPAAEYRTAFADAHPNLGAEESRARLAAFFEELAGEVRITLPRSERLYDRAGVAKLPAWIDISREGSPREPLPVDPRMFPW